MQSIPSPRRFAAVVWVDVFLAAVSVHVGVPVTFALVVVGMFVDEIVAGEKCGVVENLVGGTFSHDGPTLSEHDYPVGDFVDEVHIVCGDKQRFALVLESEEYVDQLRRASRIESGCRFVQE